MKKTFAYYVSEAGALGGIALSLCFWYIFFLKFVAEVYAAALFWIICLSMYAGAVYLTIRLAMLDATHPYLNLRSMIPPFFFLVSGVVLAIGCVIHSEHVWNLPTWTKFTLFAPLPAIPLGVWVLRCLADPWRPLAPRTIAVGSICGILAFLPFYVMLIIGDWFGFQPFIALQKIAVVDLFGFDLIPSLDSGNEMRRLLVDHSSGISLQEPKLYGYHRIILLPFQVLQSTLAAIWDTFLLAVCTFAVAVPIKRLFLRQV
jgi:hypothetical protein